MPTCQCFADSSRWCGKLVLPSRYRNIWSRGCIDASGLYFSDGYPTAKRTASIVGGLRKEAGCLGQGGSRQR